MSHSGDYTTDKKDPYGTLVSLKLTGFHVTLETKKTLGRGPELRFTSPWTCREKGFGV